MLKDICRSNIDNSLGKYEELFFIFQGKDKGRMIEKPVTKCDSGTQTDTHFMETNIVMSYEWNEWELRRKAIKLVGYHSVFDHFVQMMGLHSDQI